MSIIHEALQKTQHKLVNRNFSVDKDDQKSQVERVDIFLIIVIAVLLIIIVITYYPRHSSKPSHSDAIAKTAVLSQTQQPVIMSSSPSVQPVMMSQPMSQMVQPVAMMQQPQYVQVMPVLQPMMMPQMMQVVAAPQQQYMQPVTTQQAVPMVQPQQQSVTQSVTMAQPLMTDVNYRGKLVLNGVLLGDQEKIALINNQSYHLGDSIDGMKIVNIELNSITLQDGMRMMVLRA